MFLINKLFYPAFFLFYASAGITLFVHHYKNRCNNIIRHRYSSTPQFCIEFITYNTVFSLKKLSLPKLNIALLCIPLSCKLMYGRILYNRPDTFSTLKHFKHTEGCLLRIKGVKYNGALLF